MAGWAVEPEGAGEPWAAPLERRLTADLSGGILWDHGVGGELGVQDAAVCVGVHGQRVQQLPVLQHPRVQQAARLGDQLRHVLCRVKAQVLAAPARAQALVSGSLACPGLMCNPAETAGLAEAQSPLKSVPLCPAPPWPGVQGAHAPRWANPQDLREMYGCHHPAPQPSCSLGQCRQPRVLHGL